MDISFIHDEGDFKDLGREWNQLLSRSVLDVPFLRHEYQYTWWQTLGGGEWKNGQLWIAVGRGENGELLGIASCFKTQSESGVPKLMFIGSKEISDYLDLIVSTKDLPVFVESFLDKLGKLPATIWRQIDLFNIPEWSPTLEVIDKCASSFGWAVVREKLQTCPSVFLEGDWETYLNSLSKKQRHELRRKIRRVETQDQKVDFHILTETEELHEGIETFLDLMSYDQDKLDFLSQEMRSFMSVMMSQAFENGWLMLAFLKINEQVIAGYLNFDYKDHLWIYNSGINPDYLHLSPGWVLMGYIIQWAFERGRKGIDFLRGDERYKSRLGGKDRFIYRLILSR